jgi:mRNA interferase HicA
MVIIFDYHRSVTASELKRKLEKLGCEVKDGAKHWIVYYRGLRTTIPRHPSREIKTRTYFSILKELGIKGE